MGHIFISYSHKDKEYLHKLQDALQKEDFDVWVDDRIDYGTQWPKVIQDQLDASTVFILVVSDNSYESEWVQNEVARAKRKGIPFFPLLLSGDPWLSVESTQYVDVRGEKLPPLEFYERLGILVPRNSLEITKDLPHRYTKDWPIYRNEKYKFSFRDPPEAEIHEDDNAEVNINFRVPEGTNLLEKYIIVRCVEGNDFPNPLLIRRGPDDTDPKKFIINGIQFMRQITSSMAHSTAREKTAYATLFKNMCVVLTLNMRIADAGPHYPSLLPKLDLDSERQVALLIASTLMQFDLGYF